MSLRRRILELIAGKAMLAATLFSSLLVIVIGAALYMKSRPLLASKSLGAIVLGGKWQPSAGEFGLRSFIVGTVWVTGLAMVIAVPICILAAIFLAEYASPRTGP